MRNIIKPFDWPLIIRLFFVGCLYFAIGLAALLPGTKPPASGRIDLYLHALVFGVLTVITFAGFPRLWIAASIVFGFSILIEVGQIFVPERSASWDDIAANASGVSTAALVLLICRGIRRRTVSAKGGG